VEPLRGVVVVQLQAVVRVWSTCDSAAIVGLLGVRLGSRRTLQHRSCKAPVRVDLDCAAPVVAGIVVGHKKADNLLKVQVGLLCPCTVSVGTWALVDSRGSWDMAAAAA